jgi:ABC-type lipoprotein export system ATPase subunit
VASDKPSLEMSSSPQTTTKTDASAILRAVDLSKMYGSGNAAVHALRGVSLNLQAGTITAVIGRSGSGKSTLLHILSGIDTPTTGDVWIEGVSLSQLSEAARAHWRARHMGFVLQRDNLIPSLTVEENVAAPYILAGGTRRDGLRLAREALNRVELAHRANAWPSTLSGGEAQRATVARACAGRPRLIFSDEPTGALDSAMSQTVLDLLASLSRESGAASMVVTHDMSVAAIADVVVRMDDGHLTDKS